MKRLIDLKLVEPAAYGRLPLWEARDREYPSIHPVQFRANDRGDGNIMQIASRLLDDSERKCSVDCWFTP